MLDALVTFSIRVVGAAVAFGLQALLARLMGVSDFGHYVLVWTWLLSIGSLATLGFAESAVRFAPRYATRGRAGLLARFFDFGSNTVAAASVAIAIAGGLLTQFLPLADSAKDIAFYVAISIPFLALEYFLDGMARAMGWFRLTSIVIYIVRPIGIALMAISVHLAGIRLSSGLVCGLVVFALVLTTYAMLKIMRRRVTPVEPQQQVRSEQRRLWLKASLPLLVVATLDDLMLNGDVALVGVLLSPADAASYFVAGRILVLAAFAQFAFYFVFGRRFSVALADRNRAKLKSEFHRATLATILATIGSIAVTLAAAPYLLMVYGNEYAAAIDLIWLLSIAFLARSVSGQAHELLMIMGYQRALTVINGAAIVLGAVMIIVLARMLHVEGAAIAVGIISALRSLALYVLARQALFSH